MKTIQDLNKKIWYRTIKVFYIFLVFIFCISSVILLYDELSYNNFTIDSTESIVKIHNLIQPVQKLSKQDLFSDAKKVMDTKGVDKQTALINTLNYYKTKGLEVEGVDIDIELSQLIEEQKVKEENKFIWIKILLSLLISIFLTYVIFFQIFNRAFYYIVLWTLFPKKD